MLTQRDICPVLCMSKCCDSIDPATDKSDYDGLKAAECLVIEFPTRVNRLSGSYCPYLLLSKTAPKETSLPESVGKEDPVEVVSSLTL